MYNIKNTPERQTNLIELLCSHRVLREEVQMIWKDRIETIERCTNCQFIETVIVRRLDDKS